MTMKTAAATLAAAAAACVVSAGTAHADVLPATTPFVDPVCLCAGLLPGRVDMGAEPGSMIGARYIKGNLNSDNDAAGAEVRYWRLPSSRVTLQALGAQVAKDVAPVQYGTFRGRPSFTVTVEDDSAHVVEIVFIDGDRAFELIGGGETLQDAQGALDELTGSFQLL
ncbi:hypothetical protein [Nocardia stercoris]|uniref:DUF3558 domain-containing protein n=1 Tax=Nocardia stercoris TaxID=2483361 RepID=A0A3M2KZH7_9NOCA|nr:hypothetical protein [Nocardia stercoris]RMI27718.1 hypothetical protein EBN03_33150 [Nocardia stercoris]